MRVTPRPLTERTVTPSRSSTPVQKLPRTAVAGRSRAATSTSRSRRCHRIFLRPRVSRSLAAAVVGAVLFSVLGSDSAQASTQVLAFAKSVSEVFDHIRDWLTGILAGLATVFLTIGGVRYLMASGDPGEVEKAKQSFKSAGWGFGLAALAPLVVEILRGIVGA